MKINKYIVLISSVAVITSCDLDKFPEGGTVTQDQKNEVVEMIPERLSSEINGLKTGLYQHTNLILSDYHFDYGFPAVCMMYEMAGQDMTCSNDVIGYNWYISSQHLSDRTVTSLYNSFMWKQYYTHIKIANDILKSIPLDTENPTLKKYRGQALAARAFDYLQLIQSYQFTYIGHESSKGVPIVLDTTEDEVLTNNPRATVQEVYTQIMEDLNNAISMLTGVKSRSDKGEISLEVAYGLRARANLLMGQWKAAASDAVNACTGFTAYSTTQVSKPAFYASTDNAWIWGIVITPEDYLVKTAIVNWPSMLCSLTGMGYTTAADAADVSYRAINSDLWSIIPASDVRKGWWVDTNLHSDVLDNGFGEEDAYGWANGLYGNSKFSPYVNVKFGPEDGEPANQTNSQDWPLMRVEEMKLIEAEAIGRENLGEGKQKLEAFVRAYRDPQYTCSATNVEEFVDAVWLQRRIELWGEGFSFFDLLRLKKPLVRSGANFPVKSTFGVIKAESPIMIYMIPESETSVNKAITPSDNNEPAIPPTPVVGK